jgi:hypothetical protein
MRMEVTCTPANAPLRLALIQIERRGRDRRRVTPVRNEMNDQGARVSRRLSAVPRFGRAALLTGWLLFALSALLSPCLDAIAAPASHGGEAVAESLAGGDPAGPKNDDAATSCHDSLALAVSRNADNLQAPVLSPSFSGAALSEGETAFVPLLPFDVYQRLRQYEAPPPTRPLYLRTLRLLI